MGKRSNRLKDDFNMNTTSQVYFWKSEWEKFDPTDPHCTVSYPYLFFRFGMLVYFFVGTVLSMSCSKQFAYYFLFLTNLNFILQFIYNSTYFSRLLWVWFQRRDLSQRSLSPKLPWAERVIWAFININAFIPYLVTVGYWGFIYDSSVSSTPCQTATDYSTHAFNSLMALIDILVMAVPIRLSHFIFPLIAGLSYTLFTGLYELGHLANWNTYPNPLRCNCIYSFLDWHGRPGFAALTVVFGIIGAALLQALSYNIYRFRVFLAFKFLKIDKRSESDPKDAKGKRKGTLEDGYDNPIEVAIEDGSKAHPDYRTFTEDKEQKT